MNCDTTNIRLQSPFEFTSEVLCKIEPGHCTFLSDKSRFTHKTRSPIRIVHGSEHAIIFNIHPFQHFLCVYNSNSLNHISSKFKEYIFQKCNTIIVTFVRKVKKCRKTNVNKSEVIFSNYLPYAIHYIMYNLVQFIETLAWSSC